MHLCDYQRHDKPHLSMPHHKRKDSPKVPQDLIPLRRIRSRQPPSILPTPPHCLRPVHKVCEVVVEHPVAQVTVEGVAIGAVCVCGQKS